MAQPLQTLSKDQARLHRLRSAMRRNPADASAQAAYDQAQRQSHAAYELRRQGVPEVRIADDLPVGEQATALMALLQAHQVLVVAGETGSGKTTQLPKICLAAGRGIAGMIGCTQPRRIAARAVAKRVADELQTSVGAAVGFQVRFNEQVGEQTYLKFMTDGILLAEIQSDPWLSRYDTLIIDEAHERSLNIDFLLGFLKKLIAKRKDLKLIITSATIDTGRFSAHFNHAPVVQVQGRSFPVEVRYRDFQPLETDAPRSQRGHERADDLTLAEKIVHTVDEISHQDGLGDILVFLPGEREIREAHLALEKRKFRSTEILPLYARLSNKDQDRVFMPGPGRRIVLATNVAETSLTVPRIRYVIDPGLARVKRYSPRQKMDRLQIEPISQASANQRMGRCGRVAAGICYRLYAEADFNQRPAFTDPEIKRASLAGVVLRMPSLKLGALEQFPFVDLPDARAINDGWQNLAELGAIDKRRDLTAIGRDMAQLPIDVKLSRMLVEANRRGVLHELTVIAAFMGVSDPRERPADAKAAADTAHKLFAHAGSEFLSVINLWRAFRQAHDTLSQSQLRKWCERHFVSYLRMREWRELHRQLLVTCQSLQWNLPAWDDIEQQLLEHEQNPKAAAQHYRQLHCAVLAGLPTQVGHRNDKGLFEAPRQRRFSLFPASPLAKQPPAWCMVGQLLDTQRVWGLMAAKIEPEWIVDVCDPLLSRQYFDPHWSRRQGRVVGSCQMSLLGLRVVAKQAVHYGTLFPEESRDIFIRQALLTGEINARAPFIARNLAMRETAHAQESKQRRIGLVVDEDWQVRWYKDRIPAEINSADALDRWHKGLPEKTRQSLLWQLSDLLLAEPSQAVMFPEYLALGNNRLALHYRFAPGEADDGVSLDVPMHLLNALDPARLSWLVPGVLEEKVAALIRALPKALRRNYVPAPDFARAFCQAYPQPEGDALTGTLARFLSKTTGAPVTALDFDEAALEPHLRMNIRLADARRHVLAQSRDVLELKQRFAAEAERAFSMQAGQEFTQTVFSGFPSAPVAYELRTPEGLIAYPALAYEQQQVHLRAFATRAEADREHDSTVRILLRSALADAAKRASKQLPVDTQRNLLYSTFANGGSLREDCVAAAMNDLLAKDFSGIRDLPAFEQAATASARQLFARSQQVMALLEDCMGWTAKIRSQLTPSLMGWATGNLADIKAHLERLVYPGFLAETPAPLLANLPRYLKALHLRQERALQDPIKDQARMLELQPFNSALAALQAKAEQAGSVLAFRLDVEELNVQVFAQELAQKGAVSRKRLAKQLAELT